MSHWHASKNHRFWHDFMSPAVRATAAKWRLVSHSCPSILVAKQLFPEPARALVFQESCSLLPPPVPIFAKVSYDFL